MTLSAVQISHLTKTIGKKNIVDDLSLEIAAGEVFGLLGPNGAGKTTTIRMMVGLISITGGEVRIHGLDVSRHFTEAMMHVGAIVENPEMYGYLSGYQNLRHYARMCSGVTAERIREVVQQVGLEQRIHDRVRTYSLGMRQRLGLAQALLRKPSVLILDEPTNGLDPAGIRELRDYLRRLAADEGLTVVVSSHLLSEMELMCDRVAIIQSGKLIDVRTLNEVSTDANTLATVAFELETLEAGERAIAAQWPELQLASESGSLRVEMTREQVPEVVAALVAAGVKVYAVRTIRQSLEDEFLAITGGRSVD